MNNRSMMAMYNLGFGLGLLDFPLPPQRRTSKKPVPTAAEIAEKEKKRKKNKQAKLARKKNRGQR